MDEKGYAHARRFPRAAPCRKRHRLEAPRPELQDRGAHQRDKCIGCGLCYIACWDGAHQCIHLDAPSCAGEPWRPRAARASPFADRQAGRGSARNRGLRTPPVRIPRVDEAECVGCNLCWLVCPVENCITMERVDTGGAPESWEQRTGAACIDTNHSAYATAKW